MSLGVWLGGNVDGVDMGEDVLLLIKGEEVFVFNDVVLIVVLVLLLSCPLLGARVPKRRKRMCR